MSLKVKVKWTLVQALRLCTVRTAHRGSRGIALLFLDHGTRRGWGVSITPRPLFTPGERPDTHCTAGWVGPRAGLDMCGKSRPPPGFDPRTVQPVASRYTNYATRPISVFLRYHNNNYFTLYSSKLHITILPYYSVEITNKMQPCVRIYYSTVYWRLNMFRAAYRSSSGALTIFAAFGLHTHVVTGRTWLQPVTTCVCKPEAANTIRAPDDERYAARNMLSLQWTVE